MVVPIFQMSFISDLLYGTEKSIPFQGLYAIIEFASVEARNTVLEQQNHRLNSQNLIVKSRDVQVVVNLILDNRKLYFSQIYNQAHNV